MAEWPDDAVEMLRKGWAEGLSASQISRTLAYELGEKRTRNSVIGKVHRLGLAYRNMPSRPVKQPRPVKQRARVTHVRHKISGPRMTRSAPTQLRPDLDAIAKLAPIDPKLGIARLTAFTCRYPIGDPDQPGFAFCGRTCEGPYCVEHAKLTYTRATKQRANALTRLNAWLDGRHARAAGFWA